MAFRRFRRSSFRSGRRLGQLNWVTAFGNGTTVATGVTYVPLSAAIDTEVSSDQIVQRIRGNFFGSVPVAATAVGSITLGIVVEDAKDIVAGNGAALPDPRAATLIDLEPEKYLWLGSPFQVNMAAGATNLVGNALLDVKAKRKLDVSNQQLLLVIANDSSATLTWAYYIRSLVKEKV